MGRDWEMSARCYRNQVLVLDLIKDLITVNFNGWWVRKFTMRLRQS